ncbi:MAG: UvrD-helicase domain-containing protein [Phycisphaerales bacterium]|nr:UvrD-helicase domain-containing protein [Phycisphaerales bacterium]
MVHADPILEGLNEPQREAVAHQEGPLLVLAGPGSGKTRVITRRAARLARDAAPASAILAITFTNKAADEMRRRITALGAGAGMWICTFHSLGARLLRAYGQRIGVEPGFSIYDEADRKQTMKSAMEEASVGGHVLTVDKAIHAISAAKNELRTPAGYEVTARDFNERMIARVYEAYEALLKKQNAADFDDLLLKPAQMLGEDDDLRRMLNQRFQYLLIDEYQDTNHAQYLVARRLSELNQNICATGDPDQSIYGWRGANLDNILDFERDYPDTRVVRLEQNYRSTGAILRAASTVIRANRRRKDKELWTEGDDGEPLRVWRFASGSDESEHIAQNIVAMSQDGVDYADFAIMYRVNAVSRGVEDALRARRIPYRIIRGVEFYNRREIRDTVAYLRVLMNPRDEQALLRIINTPARGIGKKTIERLLIAAQNADETLLATIRRAHDVPGVAKGTAKKLRSFVTLLDRLSDHVEGPLDALVGQVLEQSGYEQYLREAEDDSSEDRLANVMELVTVAARYQQEEPDGDLDGFLARVSLTSDQDAVDPNAGCVQLMTLHAAKGLEFPVVFLVGVEQGLLPHERSLSGPFGVDEASLEEERRLFFVGLTRAMRRLHISYADMRAIRGRLTPRSASQFVGELPDSAAVVETISRATFRDARSRYNDQDAVWDEAEFAPADEAGQTSRRRGGFRPRPERRFEFQQTETYFSVDDPTTGAAPTERGRYADWSAGTWVRHDSLGVGQVIWIQPSSGQTRAAIKFAGQGQRVYILEHAPIHRLERPSPQ